MLPGDLQVWLQHLLALHPKDIELGLDRVAAVAAELPLDRGSAKVITVAGTNGKGSTIAACTALLQVSKPGNSSPRVGVYTSPHLLRFNERIVIDGTPCSDGAICDAFAAVERARQRAGTGRAVPLTFFEFTTLAALYLFARQALDYWLLEVGLGGRLDAVNIIDPDIAVVTQVGLDHQDYLGDTRESIGREKAGILRPGIPVVISDPDPPRVLLDIARDKASDLRLASAGDFQRFASMQPRLHPLSWWAAQQVLALLGLDVDTATLAGLCARTGLAGRFSTHHYRQREVILDVAHNSDSVGRLCARLCDYAGANDAAKAPRLFAVFAALEDKPVADMLAQLAKLVDHWYFVQINDTPRARSVDSLVEIARDVAGHENVPHEKCGNMQAALDLAVQQSSANDKILVTGSFYTVAEALRIIE